MHTVSKIRIASRPISIRIIGIQAFLCSQFCIVHTLFYTKNKEVASEISVFTVRLIFEPEEKNISSKSVCTNVNTA